MALIEKIDWLHNHGHEGGLWRVSYYTEDGQHEYRFYSCAKVRDELEAYARFMKEQTDAERGRDTGGKAG